MGKMGYLQKAQGTMENRRIKYNTTWVANPIHVVDGRLRTAPAEALHASTAPNTPDKEAATADETALAPAACDCVRTTGAMATSEAVPNAVGKEARFSEAAALQYRAATEADADAVHRIAQRAIRAIYPAYYPAAVVDWFAAWHNPTHIMQDIEAGGTRLVCLADGTPVGTGTFAGNHMTRVFVLPELQGNGIGSFLLDKLESEMARTCSTIELDSSLPAGGLYQKRGYATVNHGCLDILDDGGRLVAAMAYEIMEKNVRS